MREHAEVGNDILDPADAVLDVFDDVFEFGLLVRSDVFAFFAQGVQAGGGEVQRIVDLVDDAGAHYAQGGHFLLLYQLRFGCFEFFNGALQFYILPHQLRLGRFEVPLRLKLPIAQARTGDTAADNDDTGENKERHVIDDDLQLLRSFYVL